MKRLRKIMIIWAGLCILLLGGCGESNTEAIGSVAAVSMENTPVIEYTVPQLTPNILIDQNGYSTSGLREAAIKGSRLPELFRLVDAESGEVVYQGSVQDTAYHEELKLYSGLLNFEEYDTPGSYYLECDYLGQSTVFTIEDEQTAQLFADMTEELLERCRQGQVNLEEISELLTACEWYPELFQEETSRTPEVLEVLAQWTEEYLEQEPPEQQTALYAAVFAKFSYLYQHYDRNYATRCLQWATTAYEQTKSTLQGDAENFRALTELYRATGLNTYRNLINDYKTYFQNNSSYLEEPDYLYGAMTYLVTRQRVDVELCNLFMDHLMSRGEELAGRYEEVIHPVVARNNGTEELLKQVSVLTGANYVLNSYQYNQIAEDFLHYLGGRNMQSVCFYTEKEEWSGYICLLAQLTEAENEAAGRRMEESE